MHKTKLMRQENFFIILENHRQCGLLLAGSSEGNATGKIFFLIRSVL